MQTVSIGGFHDYIIGILDKMRIFDQWFVAIANVTGKNDLGLSVFVLCPYLDGCRA